MHIAIVGAGLSGLTCARRLQERGHSVVVYEKSEAAGGRMGTRQTELGGFDHGAQYFTVSSERFKKEVGAWNKAGWVKPWESKLVALENGVATPAGRTNGSARLVAVPGMAALGTRLADGLALRSGQTVRKLERFGDQWLLAVMCDTVPVDASAGPFDAVILAIPADQAMPLLQSHSSLAGQVGQEHLAPCWALILSFEQALGLDYDGAWVKGSRLKWIARNTSKPQPPPGEPLIGHSPTEWGMGTPQAQPPRGFSGGTGLTGPPRGRWPRKPWGGGSGPSRTGSHIVTDPTRGRPSIAHGCPTEDTRSPSAFPGTWAQTV